MAEIIRIIKQGIVSFYYYEGIWHYIGMSLLILIAVLIFRGFLTRLLYKAVVKVFPHAREEIAESYFPRFREASGGLIFVLGGVYWAISYLPLNPEQKILLVRLFRTSLIIVIAWGGFYNLTGGSYSSFLKNFGHKLNIDLMRF